MLIADVLDLMDSTITNIAAPTVVRDIGGGESLIKWLGAGYALAMGVRRLPVVVGLVITLAAAIGVWSTVLAEGTAVGVWALAPSLLVLGVGMGACFSSIYDVAIGDVAANEAPRASGTLSAVQQLAAGIGSAAVTTVYFTQRIHHGAGHAMTMSVAVVGDHRPMPRPGLASTQVRPARPTRTRRLTGRAQPMVGRLA